MPPRLKAPDEKLEPRRKRGSRSWMPIVVVAIAAALVAAAAISLRPKPPTASTAAQSRETPALLGGLRIGDRIAAWEVHEVRTVDRKLGVDLIQNNQHLTVWIAKKGVEQKLAPRETERYALFVGFPPESQAAATRDMDLVLGAIEQRLRRTEATSEVPQGL